MSSMRAGCGLCLVYFLILDRCFKFSNLTNTQAETEKNWVLRTARLIKTSGSKSDIHIENSRKSKRLLPCWSATFGSFDQLNRFVMYEQHKILLAVPVHFCGPWEYTARYGKPQLRTLTVYSWTKTYVVTDNCNYGIFKRNVTALLN
jgi:hypothetical protein